MTSPKDDWDLVRKLWSEWKFHEAKDRAFDFTAAEKALHAFSDAKRDYQRKHGVVWQETDVLIEVRGGVVQEVSNLAPGQKFIVIDYDDREVA